MSLPRLPDSGDFRRLWVASNISQLGDWSARLAIGILIFDRTDSALWVGFAALVFIAPYVGPGQILTAWSERFQRRSIVVSADALRAVVFVVLGLVDIPTAPFFVLLFIAAMADPVFEANISSLIVETVDEDQYDSAIRVRHLSEQLSTMVGVGLGGVLVGLMSAQAVLLVDAGTFVVSATLLAGISTRKAIASDKPSVRATLAGGFAFLRNDQTSRNAVLASMITAGAAFGVEMQIPVIGKEVADLSPAAIGLLAMTTPIGTVTALSLISTSGADRHLYYRNLVVTLASVAVTVILLGFASTALVMFGAFFMLGFVHQTSMTSNILVGKRIPASSRAIVFGLLQALILISNGTGAWVGGVLIEVFGPTRGPQYMLLASFAAVLFVIPRQTPRVKHAPDGMTTRRGQELVIDLTDRSRVSPDSANESAVTR